MLLNVQPETFFLNRSIWKLLTLCTGEGLLLGILWSFHRKDPPPIYLPCRKRKDNWKPIPTFIVSKEILTWRCIFINLSNTHLTLKKTLCGSFLTTVDNSLESFDLHSEYQTTLTWYFFYIYIKCNHTKFKFELLQRFHKAWS